MENYICQALGHSAQLEVSEETFTTLMFGEFQGLERSS